MIKGLPEITVEPVQQQPRASSPSPSIDEGRLGVTQVTNYEDPEGQELQKELDGWIAKRKIGVSLSIGGCILASACIGVPIWTSSANLGALGEGITYGLLSLGTVTGLGAVSYVSMKAGKCAKKEKETLERMDALPLPIRIETRL